MDFHHTTLGVDRLEQPSHCFPITLSLAQQMERLSPPSCWRVDCKSHVSSVLVDLLEDLAIQVGCISDQHASFLVPGEFVERKWDQVEHILVFCHGHPFQGVWKINTGILYLVPRICQGVGQEF